MSENIEKIVESLSKLTVLELAELKKALEEKWGVSAQAAVAVATAAVDSATSTPAQESTEVHIVLESSQPDKKISVIKEVRAITGLGLKEAKELVEKAPKTVKENVARKEAEEIKKKLTEAGATVTFKNV